MLRCVGMLKAGMPDRQQEQVTVCAPNLCSVSKDEQLLSENNSKEQLTACAPNLCSASKDEQLLSEDTMCDWGKTVTADTGVPPSLHPL